MGCRGWVFDEKPGVGTMCVRQEHILAARHDSDHDKVSGITEMLATSEASAEGTSTDCPRSSMSAEVPDSEEMLPRSVPPPLLSLEVRVRQGEPSVPLFF